MKLLIVTAIQECQEAVAGIFDRNGIKKYSLSKIQGVDNEKEANEMYNWFGSPRHDDLFSSIMLFSFTTDAIARQTLQDLTQYNQQELPAFPVRAVILPVEQTI
ncbi:MAG: hypothetical protein KA821_08595 [Chitinophagaceae bacterium]|nr:hypothetical protein [Chitinophagaceae bacterium]